MKNSQTQTRKSEYAARLLDQESKMTEDLAKNRDEVLEANAEFFSARIKQKLEARNQVL